MAVDWNFLGEVEGSAINRAYIPMKDGKPIQNSGVTIGTGVDLGAQTAKKLEQMGVSKALIKKLEPYLDKQQDKAVQALQDAGELVLEDAEVRELDNAVKQSHLKFVKNWFNKNNTKGMDWSDLTDRQQTVVLSVEYNHGPAALKNYNFGEQVANNEWDKVADNLRNFYSSPDNELHSRRIKELQYLVGADVDGIAGQQTDSMLETFKTSFKEGTYADYKGNVTPAQHHRPAPVREQAPNLPEGFTDQFMAMFQEITKASQARSQEVSEPIPEDTEVQPTESEEEAAARGFTESENKLIEAAVAAPTSDIVGGARPDSEFTDAELNLINRAVGTTETEEPVYADTTEGAGDGTRDPIYGIF
jgi:hypothetical protein